MIHNLIHPFKEVVSDSHQRLSSLAKSGLKIIGYFCTYTPVEILHASGFVPIRISSGPGVASKATTRLPDFICPFMKLSLEKALSGKFDFLAGIVQGYSCDAACGMVNIWKDIFKRKLFHSIPIPYNDTPESRSYFQSALSEMIDQLEAIGGSFTQTSLQNSLDLYADIRNRQLALYYLRCKGQLPISSSSLMAVVDACFLTPPEQYRAMLSALMDRLPTDNELPQNGFPILVTGSLIENPEILDIIESSGGRIVADDLCNGFRKIFPAHGEGEAPMDRLIDRYMNRFPCPARSRAVHRSQRLMGLAKDSGARGIIFLLQKFCTPHLADYPALSEEFKKNGVPSLLIEMDETWQMEAQLKTRLESFFEMMQSGG